MRSRGSAEHRHAANLCSTSALSRAGYPGSGSVRIWGRKWFFLAVGGVDQQATSQRRVRQSCANAVGDRAQGPGACGVQDCARHMRMTQGNIKQLYQCCREQSVWKGYRWRYKPQANRRTDQNQERRYGQEVVGRRLKVWKGDTCCTPMQDSRGRDHIYCAAQVRAFDAAFGKHRVRYDGGEEEMLDLAPVKLNFSASTTEARLVEQVCVRSGKVLKTLSSVLAATQSGVAASRIASMLRGDNKAAGGFFWRYCGSKTAPAVPKNNGTVAVEQVCLETGKVLRSFSSVSGAGSHHNVSISSISATLNGRIGSCGGYFWRYKGSKTRPRPSKTTKAIEQLCRDRESHGKIQVDRRGGKGCRCDGSVYQ